MAEETKTVLNYFYCGGNDRERFEKFCKKVFAKHEEHPELRMEIIIMEADEYGRK